MAAARRGRSERGPSEVTRSDAAENADADHDTGCSRQYLTSDVSHEQGGRHALAWVRRAVVAPESLGRRGDSDLLGKSAMGMRSKGGARGVRAQAGDCRSAGDPPNSASPTLVLPGFHTDAAMGNHLGPWTLSTAERAHQAPPNAHHKSCRTTRAWPTRQLFALFLRRSAQPDPPIALDSHPYVNT